MDVNLAQKFQDSFQKIMTFTYIIEIVKRVELKSSH